MMDETTKLLLKYCKKSKAKRGLEYVSQIDKNLIDCGDIITNVRQVMYVHTQFKTIHLREMICSPRKGSIVDSHYY